MDGSLAAAVAAAPACTEVKHVNNSRTVTYTTHEVHAVAGAPPLLVREGDRDSFHDNIMNEEHEQWAAEDGTGLSIWPSAYVLSRWLAASEFVSFDGKTVLELGSGCGLVGLTIAQLGAAEISLTDLSPRTLENLRHNVALNSAADSAATAAPGWRMPSVRSIAWGDRSTWPAAGSVDLIIGSDLIYDDTTPTIISPLLAHALRPGVGEFIHAHPARGRVGPQDLAAELAAVGLTLVHACGGLPLEQLHVVSASGGALPSLWPLFNEIKVKPFVIQRYQKTGA